MNIIKDFFSKKSLDKVLLRKGAPGNEQVMDLLEPIKTAKVMGSGVKETVGWVSPEYSESKPVRLDLNSALKNRCIAVTPNTLEVEAYRLLRRKIINLAGPKGWNTFMITSALPGEGKTLTAINLGLTFAREFQHTVLLVDCDFRHQSIHKSLGIKSEKGLIDHLLNGTPISEVMLWPSIEKFTLISGGKTIQESAELLGSERMKELILDMKTRYPDRYMFFDAPPLLSVADALTLASLVDGVIVVVQADETSADDLHRALEMIPKEKILGLVLNRQKDPFDKSLMKYYGVS